MKRHLERYISFQKTIHQNNWRIKLYLISKDKIPPSDSFYEALFAHLPDWLGRRNQFNDRHYFTAFLIVHVATECVFTILNWWVGENMLSTHIFISQHHETNFQEISGKGLAPCIWELEVIHHEKLAWIEHVLKKAPDMNFQAYMKDTLDKVL